MDVVFFAQAVENYLPHLHKGSDLGHYLMGMVESAMDIEPRLLRQAQQADQSSIRLMHVVNNVSLILPSFRHHTNRMAVEKYIMKPAKFDGVTCTWYSSPSDASGFLSRRIFYCADANLTLSTNGKSVVASVSMPRSVYKDVIGQAKRDARAIPLIVAAFNNASLFQSLDQSPDFDAVQSAVIGSSFFGDKIQNLTDHVTIALMGPEGQTLLPGTVQPVWWDPQANGGLGDWNPNHCVVLNAKDHLVRFSCNRLGYYGYRLQRSATTSSPGFHFHHPLIYVGGVVCLVLILAAIVIYGISFSSITMCRELKHALINVCTAMVSLIFIFCTGVHQVEHDLTCKAVGMMEHYLTLSNLIWIVLSVNIVFEKTNRMKQKHQSQVRRQNTLIYQQSDLPISPPVQTEMSMAFFYLMGWGAALIICGTCAALDLDNYGLMPNTNHCFMALIPFLVAVVLPTAILTSLLFGFGLSAWCLVSSPATVIRATESLETELHHQHTNPNDNTVSFNTDKEKSVRSLLLSLGYIYILLLSTWMCGSLSVVLPLNGTMPFEEIIFAVLFTVSSMSLGVFIFVYYCASRLDIQECWRSPWCNIAPDQPLFDQPDGQSHFGNAPGVPGEAPFRQMTLPRSDIQGHPEPEAQDEHLPDIYRKHHLNPQLQAQSSHYSGMKNYGRFKSDTGKTTTNQDDSDGSLDNVNHLRRGYFAPVNSEAEYGSLFGAPPALGTAPKTSSPATLNVPIPDQDLTLSPLVLDPRANKEESPDGTYTESSTIRMGAPCELATYDVAPEALAAPGVPPGFLNPAERLSFRERQRKRNEKYRTLPDVGERISEDEDEDNRSKVSAMSSNVSSRSSKHRYRRPKKGNKRRNRSDSDRSNVIQPNQENHFDSLDRCNSNDIMENEEKEEAVTSSQSPVQDLTSRETSV